MDNRPEELYRIALEACKKSYSPYSKVRVGAAVRFEGGNIFSGANIENASFGATVCAERVAIWKALSENASGKIADITVVTPNAWPPCGMCRQVISEFASAETRIHVASVAGGIQKTYLFSELMPEAFTPEHIKK